MNNYFYFLLANRIPNIHLNDVLIKFNPNPKYLGVTLDRTLSYNKHLKNLALKIRSRNNLIQKLAGSNWGLTAETLRISALSLVYSVAEYCAPSWLYSKHVNLVEVQLNNDGDNIWNH